MRSSYDLQKDAREARTNLAEERGQAAQAQRAAFSIALRPAPPIQALSEVSRRCARVACRPWGMSAQQTAAITAIGGDPGRPEGQARNPGTLPARRSTPQENSAGARPSRLLQQILKEDPEMADVWAQLDALLSRIERQRRRARCVQALHRA